MFPQTHHNIITTTTDGVEQMLHYLSSSTSHPIPFPNPMEQKSVSNNSNSRWKPHIEIAPNCPRCASTNTKFCYYNNYSLSQPRYFCKGCRRYWTKGGSLRNVPVGGGCRKTRRGKSCGVRNLQNDHSEDNNNNNNMIGNGHQNNGSRDIDMAVVFAKFLNQNPSSSTGDGDQDQQFESSSTPESVEVENNVDTVVQQGENSKVYDADHHAVDVGGDSTLDQELMNLSGIDEFEGFLGDVDEDVVQNIVSTNNNFWSHHHHHDHAINVSSSSTTTTTNTTWQQSLLPESMMQMQLPSSGELDLDLEYGGTNDLLGGSSSSTGNLISDSWSSWSSFDLSTMEVFSSTSTP